MLQSEQPLQEESWPDENYRSPSRRRTLGYIAEAILLATALVVVVFAIVYSVKITTGVSRNVGTPAYAIRLQVVNGCGARDAETRLAARMNGFADSDLDITVVDVGTFDLRKVSNSFVISRLQDVRAARTLAGKLGLNPAEVIYEPIENNVRSITATLVLGDDYHRIRLGTSDPKEK